MNYKTVESSGHRHTVNRKKSLIREIAYYKYIYLLLLPGLIFYIIFSYIPMYGVTLAFKEYDYAKGILHSPWVGLRNFEFILMEPEFWQAFRNTIIISFGKLITGFPAPIILAILINELREGRYKKSLQTIYTFPHFLSWVIVAGIIKNLFSSDGAINNALVALGFQKYSFLADARLFRPLLYISEIWKESGWSSIIYLAAISGIDPELYEAAYIDGANRWQRIRYITWPGIKPTAVLLFVLAVGNCMNAGFDQIFNLYNPLVYETGDIIDTYVYRITFLTNPDFGISTAVGLFKSVINFVLLISADRFLKAIGERGIY
ncbi:binding-protein-dependent transport systems inner membrane component [Caldicellulosiruptor saccharolyticus DSM 8903]|uniref:Binding-protein-dependent transport systems inner membrane component n=1 Tax=Caldicellulosiruptor saccharolyticus (strain ATCC 43494 / DSM 8903 / Tp8T 6331) TaxID=351627 RepID=A4XMH1_CALS8|nr:ABC transporter permease subunit [Caldicellulosiruptor saccharolyticus]ABP68106.1 binding-protein-dependent transport systems inner membrane component [Caldicellulosiruptor saccharolyticus DSM 8903]